MLQILAKCEGNILSQPELVEGLMRIKEEVLELTEARKPLYEIRENHIKSRSTYEKASSHAVSLYKVKSRF